jgi:hypothetical protein
LGLAVAEAYGALERGGCLCLEELNLHA